VEKARQRRVRRPPYAPVQGMREFFERVTLKAQPARVEKGYLKELGLAPGNELHVLAALRFLDLVGEDGRPTPHFRVLYYKGAERKKELQKLLRRAYPDLLSGTLDLREAAREDVHDHFVRQYGLQGQMARKARAVFAFLCSFAEIPISAGLAQEGPRSTPERAAGTARRGLAAPARGRAEVSRPQAAATTAGRDAAILNGWPMAIMLTPDMSEEDIVSFLRRVKRAIARAESPEEYQE